jgi:small GTP-binding protein
LYHNKSGVFSKLKIVVTGALQCGKSSYVKYLDNRALNIKAKGRDNKFYTVGMDMGSLKVNGFEVFLFGTPGLLRFSVMRDVVADGADGIVFMFDSTKPENDEKAISILNSIRKLMKPNTPIIFLANKKDMEEARSPEVIKTQNYLPEKSKIFPTSTITGLNIEESLKYVVNEIFDKYKETLEMMREYESNIRGLAEKLKMDKSKMRDFLNNLELKRFIDIDRRNKVYKVRKGLENVS